MSTMRTVRAAAAFGAALFAVTALSVRLCAEERTITFGASLSLSGNFAQNGRNAKDGYDLALKVVNAKGGVTVAGVSYKLAIKYEDDESIPERGARLIERLLTQDGVLFALGPYSSAVTKAVAPVIEKHRIPMIEANGADRDLFTQGYRYSFAVLSTSDQYLASAIQLLGELTRAAGRDPAALKIAIAIERDPFSEDVRDGVAEDAKKWGMKVVVDGKLPPDLDDMSPILAKVKAQKVDLLVVSGHNRGALLAVRQVAQQRIDIPMLATTHCDSADIVGKYGKAAEYWLCASQWDRSITYKDRWFGSANDFATLFESTYHYEPPYQSAESAAAVLVFADALGRAKSLAPETVRRAIAATDMRTFYGQVKFDATGKNIAKPMVLYQIQNGRYVVVAPQPWANAKIVFPMPRWSERSRN